MTAIERQPFHLAECGITRFPANVEQLLVDVQGNTVRLTARRNDIELNFPMTREEALHLAALLTAED